MVGDPDRIPHMTKMNTKMAGSTIRLTLRLKVTMNGDSASTAIRRPLTVA
jgi:hypothetical protein